MMEKWFVMDFDGVLEGMYNTKKEAFLAHSIEKSERVGSGCYIAYVSSDNEYVPSYELIICKEKDAIRLGYGWLFQERE